MNFAVIDTTAEDYEHEHDSGRDPRGPGNIYFTSEIFDA